MRILFVARPISVHTARWINQLADKGWDIHLFPAYDAELHSDLKNITTYQLIPNRQRNLDPSVRARVLWPLAYGAYGVRAIVHRLPARLKDRAGWLARVISWLKPDILHTLEFQMAGYLTLRTKAMFKGSFPPWVVSNWGSDIYLYGPLAEHTEKIKGLLSNCDYYACECQRDVALARAYGFKGEALPVLPIAGGFHVEKMQQYRQPGPTGARRLIALKGYQHWAGRSLFGLRAIELCADVLKAKGYRVAVYLAEPDTRIAAERIGNLTGLPIEIVPPGSHEDMLRLHAQARVSIGLSISDGLSTSALEAMVMGSFPIQSNTSCLNELIRDGETGILVPPEDPIVIAAAIRRAVSDDTLVDQAAEINARIVFERLDYSVVQPQIISMYENLNVACRATRGGRQA